MNFKKKTQKTTLQKEQGYLVQCFLSMQPVSENDEGSLLFTFCQKIPSDAVGTKKSNVNMICLEQ